MIDKKEIQIYLRKKYRNYLIMNIMVDLEDSLELNLLSYEEFIKNEKSINCK